jgi:hypothetical protein
MFMMIAMHVFLIFQLSGKIGLHCFICTSCTASIETDASTSQSILRPCSDSAADQHIRSKPG